MSVYTTIFAGSTPDRRPGRWAASPRAFGIAVAMAVGGASRSRVGIGALASGPPGALDRPLRPATPADAQRNISALVPRAARPPLDASRPYALGRAEDQRRVEPAEPERRRQHAPIGAVPACAEQPRQQRRHVRIGSSQVHRRRRPAVADRERADGGLDRARRARADGRRAPWCRSPGRSRRARRAPARSPGPPRRRRSASTRRAR